MRVNLRRAGWRFASALAVMLGSQTLALAQFSTAIPVTKERELPPTPTFASSPPPSQGTRNLPTEKTSAAAERSRKPSWPRVVSESRHRDENPPAVSPALKATGPRPLPAAPAKGPVTTVSHRFAESARPAGSSMPPARTTGNSRIPEIRLRPIGVIPPDDE